MSVRHIVSQKTKRGYVVEQFSSAHELLEKIGRRKPTGLLREFGEFDETGRVLRENPKWYGAASVDEAKGLLRNGIELALGEFKASFSRVSQNTGEKRRIRSELSPAGFQPVVPLAMMGLEKSMISQRIERTGAKIVRILYDPEMTSNISEEEAREAGKTVLEAVVALEKRGYRAEIDLLGLFMSRDREEDSYGVTLSVKKPDRALDIKRLIYPMTHTSFFRVLLFWWYDTSENTKFLPLRGTSTVNAFSHNREKIREEIRGLFGCDAHYISRSMIREWKEREKSGGKSLHQALSEELSMRG